MNKTALIIDDDRTERRLTANLVRSVFGLVCHEAEHGKDALRILGKRDDVCVVFLDLDMPVMGGFETLQNIRLSSPRLPVIVMTASAKPEDAIRAIEMGATDFLQKPAEPARLEVSVRNALKMALMDREISDLREKTGMKRGFSALVGHDAGLSFSVSRAKKAAACDLPVLITGETGTGKEVFAKAIHQESARRDQPFVALNCGAIPEKLIESTLFGHEKGAFTGAVARVAGKFVEADGGTIFLDEIGELPLQSQVKLLRVLQEGEIEPVGAGRTARVDVRIISATNRNLLTEISGGRFREDFFYRLNVLPLSLPPLRERVEDIGALAMHFIEAFCTRDGRSFRPPSPDFFEKLRGYTWPGNVRELENSIGRSVAFSDSDRLNADDLLFSYGSSGPRPAETKGGILLFQSNGEIKSLRAIEREVIMATLDYYGQNVTKTAKALGIAKSTLYTKMNGLLDIPETG